jgi:hypothetical protein
MLLRSKAPPSFSQTPISTASRFSRHLSLLSFMAATLLDEKSKDIQHNWDARALKRDSGSWVVSCNRRPDLPGDAEERRIDDDADGNRNGRSYETGSCSRKGKIEPEHEFSWRPPLFCYYKARKSP